MGRCTMLTDERNQIFNEAPFPVLFHSKQAYAAAADSMKLCNLRVIGQQ